MKDQRPSPEMLLEEAQNENLGRLKIFLGAAPGVGKTYAMLGAARARSAEGIDTVIGIVETHKRSETEALIQGLESIPQQTLDYRGLTFEEMDLDAILKRKPKLVLVDELAHTNIPGARHPKRYQDVQELLEAGIDVYSTLNIQHIESLNDIVARITGVTVRETVPDTVMQMAHAIELIDLPPDELLQRLKDGKVYIPEQARLAVNRFFTPGNLTALRELALRQAAERVDDQMTTYMRRHSIEGPWPTSNRIMVCISDDRQAAALVRTARRSAERRQVPWLVLYIETSRHSLLSDNARNDIAMAMQMAESMSAETMTVTSEDVAGEILRIARERNVSTIIIGKSVRSMWSRLTRPSVAAAVLDQGDGVRHPFGQQYRQQAVRPGVAESRGKRRRFLARRRRRLWQGAVGHRHRQPDRLAGVRLYHRRFLSFLYLIAVFMVVIDLGLRFSILATLLSGVALDLLMNRPDLALLPRQHEDMMSLLFFLTVGFTISFIGDYLHRQIKVTRRNAERTQSLYDFTKSIAAAATIDDVAQATVRRVAMALGARTALLLPHHDRLEIVAAVPADLHLDTASGAAMDWAWRHGKPAGFRSNTLPGAAFYGLPLQSGNNRLGVLAVTLGDGGEHTRALSPDQNHFLSSLVYQAASAIERARLVTDVAQARLQTETEKLRASLLSSISHDLRAPLDNIIAIAHDLHKDWHSFSPTEQRSQIGTVENEADRLNRYVENLLDMTELITGNMRFSFEPADLRVLIRGALDSLKSQIGSRQIIFDCPDALPLVVSDQRSLNRVFINVIENACKYAPEDQPVTINLRLEGSEVRIAVNDHGPGIPEAERERVFDMFYRIKSGGVPGSVGGAGLGLSICRSLIEAHKGNIVAQSGDDGIGSSIVIRLPVKAAE